MIAIDPKETAVVLLGCGTYEDPNLKPIPQIPANVRDLAALFRERTVIGVTGEDRVLEVVNPPNRDHAVRKLIWAARQAQDTLIIYYAGHGLVGYRKPELYLAVGTTPQNNPDDLGIPYELISNNLRESKAKKKIVILDCCFSGRALNVMSGYTGDLVRASVFERGVYTLTACGPNQQATFEGSPTHTDFTGALITLLREGVEGGPEFLTTEYLHDRISAEFHSRLGRPDPQQLIFQGGGKIAIAVNKKFRRAEFDIGDHGAPSGRVAPAPDAAQQLGQMATTLEHLPAERTRYQERPQARVDQHSKVLAKDTLPPGQKTALKTLPSTSIDVQSLDSDPSSAPLLKRVVLGLLYPGWVAFWLVDTPNFFGAVGGGIGVILAILHRPGWSWSAWNPESGRVWDGPPQAWHWLADAIAGPAGSVWVAVLAGAILGCIDYPAKMRDDPRVNAIRPRFWEFVRAADPLAWFLVRWWVVRRLVWAAGTAIIAGAVFVSASTCADVFGPNYGIKLGALAGVWLSSRCLTAMWAWFSVIPIFTGLIYTALRLCCWLVNDNGPASGAEVVWLMFIWSAFVVSVAAWLKLVVYKNETDRDESTHGWRMVALWLIGRLMIIAIAGRAHWAVCKDVLYYFDGHTAKVSAVAFVPQTSFAVSGGYDGTVRVCRASAH